MSILTFATGPSSIKLGDSNEYATTDAAILAPNMLEGLVTTAATDADDSYCLRFTGQNNFWFSTYLRINGTIFYAYDGIMFRNGTNNLFAIASNTSEQIYLKYFNGTSWATLDTLQTFSGNTLYRLDINVDMVNGVIKIYRNGALINTVQGDIDANGATCDNIKLGRIGYNNGTTSAAYSAPFVATEDTRDIEMVQRSFFNETSSTTWDGDYTDINSVGATNDSTYYSTDELYANQCLGVEQTMPSEFNETDYRIVAQGIYARAKANADSSVGSLRIASSDYTNAQYGAYKDLDVVYMPIQDVFHTAPDSGNWSFSVANACEVMLSTGE